jgi:hypothetical protein
MMRLTMLALVASITTTAHAQGLVPYYGPDGQVYYRRAPDPGYAPPGVPPDIIAPERRGAPRQRNAAPPIAVAPLEPLAPEPPPPMTPAPTAPNEGQSSAGQVFSMMRVPLRRAILAPPQQRRAEHAEQPRLIEFDATANVRNAWEIGAWLCCQGL